MHDRFRHRSPWGLTFAPLVWSVHLLFAYTVTAIVCAKGGDPASARLLAGGSGVAALALIALIGWIAWRQWDYLEGGDRVHDKPTVKNRRQFLGHAGLLLSIVSAVAVIYVTLPVLFIETCS